MTQRLQEEDREYLSDALACEISKRMHTHTHYGNTDTQRHIILKVDSHSDVMYTQAKGTQTHWGEPNICV